MLIAIEPNLEQQHFQCIGRRIYVAIGYTAMSHITEMIKPVYETPMNVKCT